jgi:glycosyltransferase involved in cell wall biosynthesis
MQKKLRIAQVGTIWESTPPKLYGGTERVVYDLTEELVKRGHDVTLFATGDSKTSAKLQSVIPKAAYRQGIPWTNFLYPLYHYVQPFERADEFDLIHFHFNTRQDYAALILAGAIPTPVLFTLHFVLPGEKEKDKQDRLLFLKKYKDRHFSAISDKQRTLPYLNYAGTVHNGLNFSKTKWSDKPGEYLLWIGRICKDKGTKEAVQVALKSGMKLILAGKLDPFHPDYMPYFEKEVKPYIDNKQIKFIGEIGDKDKDELFKGAKAFLNPIRWNEPFGLVTIEAMARGVPVIAFDNGPVHEQIRHGKTGFIVKNVSQMVNAVKKIDTLDRAFIREYALTRFSSEAMTDGYEELYKKILNLSK